VGPSLAVIRFPALLEGFNGHYVNYISFPGDAPAASLSGGATVIGWQLIDSKRNVWSAQLPPGVSDVRQVYINAERANRTSTGKGFSGTVQVTSWGYTTSDTSPLSWVNVRRWIAPPIMTLKAYLLCSGRGHRIGVHGRRLIVDRMSMPCHCGDQPARRWWFKHHLGSGNGHTR
jgi:hypothetical protein